MLRQRPPAVAFFPPGVSPHVIPVLLPEPRDVLADQVEPAAARDAVYVTAHGLAGQLEQLVVREREGALDEPRDLEAPSPGLGGRHIAVVQHRPLGGEHLAGGKAIRHAGSLAVTPNAR